MGDAPFLPSINLPSAPNIPRVTLDIPRGELPSYTPLVVPPSDLERPPGVKAEGSEEGEQKTTASEVTQIKIPIIDKEIPFPRQEILVTAGTTASVSVAATLTATWAFKRSVQVLKPLIKQLVSRIWKKNQKAKA